jgi:glycosyltransferase involved in cell wall biosynthesis
MPDAREEPTPATPDAGGDGRFLTVGIPVFNGRSLLRACLASVVDGTFPQERYEILVADDGSTEPETRAILDELTTRFADRPGFFRVLRSETNSGGAARPRNRILDEAVGAYVFFVDSDDTIGSEALARIADALAATPADWVALHQVLVNGRVGAASVRQPRMDVPRMKALTTLTVHKVFRRAEVERQGLRFDEGLPSGQDIAFAFSYLLGARRFLMLGGYDYYFLTRHAGDPNEPPHLSRRANTAERAIDKNHRILRSMLEALRASDLPEDERRAILCEIALPRVLLQQRYLASVVSVGAGAGPAALRELSALLADPLVAGLTPADLKKGLTVDHLRVVAAADWNALRDLLRQPDEAAPAVPVGRVARWRERGRHLVDQASGRARHRQLLDELAALRRSVNNLQKAQVRLEADLRADHLPAAPGAGGTSGSTSPRPPA